MMEPITSRSNEKVKYIKALNDKKARQQTGMFYLEGIKVVKEVISSKQAVDILFIAYSDVLLQKANGGEELLQMIKQRKDGILLSAELFSYMTDTKTPQGILVVLKQPMYDLNTILQKENRLLLLDQVQDAGNLGTIIRTADAFAVKTVICLEGTVDVYSPKVLRATMGAITRVKTIMIGTDQLDEIKQYGHHLVGTSLQTETFEEERCAHQKEMIVLGNEANGISKLVESKCDTLVKIRMSASAESLNVGIAAGIMLYDSYLK